MEDFSVIGKDNSKELEAIGFDMSLLDKASELSARMGDILGETNAGTINGKNVRLIRLQAYTLLKQLIIEVRDYGKYAFHGNRERLKGYSISFSHKRKTKKVKENVTLEAAEQREAA